jgi:hypothetical protein
MGVRVTPQKRRETDKEKRGVGGGSAFLSSLFFSRGSRFNIPLKILGLTDAGLVRQDLQ